MRILVCGGRAFANPVKYGENKFPALDHKSVVNDKAMEEYKFVHDKMSEIILPLSKFYVLDGVTSWLPTDITIISGKAKGVDSTAIDWAIVNWAKWIEYAAKWQQYGSKAGPLRNQQMIDEGKPDLVVAFPGGTGTADMKRRAHKHGIKVIEVKYDSNDA